jgi:formylglycine-generating enzyme required for sulfatase activity
MPQPAQLPDSLKNFAFLNAAPVDTGRDFHPHMERLIGGIDQIADRGATRPGANRSREEVAPLTGTAKPGQDVDADKVDLAVFRDAPFAPELVVLPQGEFMMGLTTMHKDGQPQHRVTIARRFAIGRYPVTFDEYDRFCQSKNRNKPEDQGWGRGPRPVIRVSWQDAQAYVAWLSQETGRTYRLPSEAEWEYACRAGTTSLYSFGDTMTPENANSADSGLGRTSKVDAYPANPWGLYDMHGNVWEWVEDDWHENYGGAPSDGSAWKDAARDSRLCVLRGGSWSVKSWDCWSAFRSVYDIGGRLNDVGFRVGRTLS